jgi:aryl-alcohol dehydrogenase-like predicted oxidoreductase
MRYRRFGRLGWRVSEIGYGMWGVGGTSVLWGIGGWNDTDYEEALHSIQLAVDLGCNFFDTAPIYGDGRSERLLGEVRKGLAGLHILVATKVPPKTGRPTVRGDLFLDVFPYDHVMKSIEGSLENLKTSQLDLLQFHFWEDAWATKDDWRLLISDLKRQRLVRGIGISVNTREPWNALQTLRTGDVDAVQVVYNIFDQSAEDDLLPLCGDLDIAVIARVPLDVGGLSGTLTKSSTWPADDVRTNYFTPEVLSATVDRVEALVQDLPQGSKVPDVALRFVISNQQIATVIPGMRRRAHVTSNLATGDLGPLAEPLM